MADEQGDNQDRTEEATPERREEFRERGQIAVSREVTSVFVLAGSIGFMSFYFPIFSRDIKRILVKSFQSLGNRVMTPENFMNYLISLWMDYIYIILPLFLVTMSVATFITLSQTRLNWSWKKLKPDFSRLNPLKGVVQMVNSQALMNLLKGIGKMLAVGSVGYLVLYSEWTVIPGLLQYPVEQAWTYWGDIIEQLFWSVTVLLLLIASVDYIYNFMSLEKKLKMTKQEVKEDMKKREVDPHIKGKMRRMQREISMGQMMEATKDATVVVTNPTHYLVALKYEMGMKAPIVVAKGVDFDAKRLKEVAKDFDVPIVENKPLARTLYKIVKVGQEIPDSLYRAVSEVIRYVFKLKGRRINR